MINRLNKKILRKQILDSKKLLSRQAILEKSNKIVNKLIKFDKYQQSKKIMLYIATKTEVQTQKIIESAQKDYKNIYIPVIFPKKHDLEPSLVYDFNKELTLGELGVYQPKEDFFRIIPPTELDLVIIPGVAFSLRGDRLGRGGGYYDRFLKKLTKKTVVIALAFEMQIVEEIPLEDNDVPVNYIITENRIIQKK